MKEKLLTLKNIYEETFSVFDAETKKKIKEVVQERNKDPENYHIQTKTVLALKKYLESNEILYPTKNQKMFSWAKGLPEE